MYNQVHYWFLRAEFYNSLRKNNNFSQPLFRFPFLFSGYALTSVYFFFDARTNLKISNRFLDFRKLLK